ncbi:MAG: hypothetical protein HY748_13630, partial [Elusimicrobia bacterium]|nr:hypothetical protein [Elusimicrobiota bacterium]
MAGNKYMIEVYAKDQAGNKHVLNCPYKPGDPASNCLTGDDATPKYVRYFKVDKTPPTAGIVTPSAPGGGPLTVGSNKLGGYLAQITGTASDVGFGVNAVEYTLKFNASDPTYHWQHFVSSGEWKSNYVAAAQGWMWNNACDSVKGCGIPGGDFAAWISSNVAFL